MKTTLKSVIEWYFNLNSNFSENKLKEALNNYEYFLYDCINCCELTNEQSLEFIIENLNKEFDFLTTNNGFENETFFEDYSFIHMGLFMDKNYK